MMSDVTERLPINPAMVTLAREARGLTQTDLSRLIRISQALLSKFEAGLSEPDSVILTRLAESLDYPEQFFSQTDPVFGPGLSEFFHRRRQDVSVKLLSRIHAQINIIRMHVARMLRAVDLPELGFQWKAGRSCTSREVRLAASRRPNR
jgi:transcriptional regulator with XRE-family HTH domain